ncbi:MULTISPECIES: DUF484 family protein [Vibrio]|uniref:DUF484 family protein n=1 Tax=Vibrio casei TaxID=673372 RepID=A0A368LKX7_9VIBR|nr:MULTISPECIES: DUF484 family protein [Vibrio]RCS72163.1 DUF484 family protein [Vibrio casei]SJN21508.1 Protein of unknown function DUF484 [Vibrio casei]HBV76531.1 DUF484 domain-containing protein [Vibrio sp.]
MQPDHLTAETVAEYLKDNRDFFQERPELVERLSFSHQQQGAVSLVEIQMRRQRQRIEELEEDITQLMSLAAKNDRTFHQLMDMQQQLLACDSLFQLNELMTEHTQKMGLKAHLLLLNQVDNSWHLSSETYKRFLTNHLNGKDAYLGRLNRHDRHALFGGDRFAKDELAELGSYVVLPLHHQSSSLGLLAFSSQEGGHFQPEMDTLFLRHLSSLVAFLVANFDQEMINQPVKTLNCANES